MPCSRKFLSLSSCAALSCLSIFASGAEKKDKDKGKEKAKAEASADSGKNADAGKEKEKKNKGEAKDDRKPMKLSIPLPAGQDSKGVVIPYTDVSGKRSMMFKIGVGTRMDEQHIKMANLVIETYSEGGEPEMTIELPSSVLDLESRVITGDQKVTVSRSDFQITGRDMEFNTETKQGRIKGDVKMIIYDLTEEAGGPPAPVESAESKKGD